MEWQQTLRNIIVVDGIALHSGEPARMVLSPADVGTGVVFQRSVPGQTMTAAATIDHVLSTELATTLRVGAGVGVATIEHLMAALVCSGVDNCVVAVDCGEIPIVDGSSKVFVDAIAAAGTIVQPQRRRQIRIKRPISVRMGDSRMAIEPWNSFAVDLTIDFNREYFSQGAQRLFLDHIYDRFAVELAAARTFAFREDIASMRRRGLALGGSLDNAVVVDGDCIQNPGGLRYPDELIRHKMLDIVGDLFLTGHRLIGKVTACKPGHRLNCMMARAIVDNPQCCEIVRSDAALFVEDDCLELIA